MTRPPSPHPSAPLGIAALLGVLLRVLLAALLGAAKARPRDVAAPGLLTGILRAEQDAEFAFEPLEEWIAVPAPWRAGQGIRRSCPRAATDPRRAARPHAGGRGPPTRQIPSETTVSGIA